ncbi:MAG: DUF3301 domain-containing protein [Reinekea forsetii]|uniref:DUF3301 domain-containing protein n=1 Tax=Reinekea TaxID=230494 RepID=UPI0023569138|nr:MULTISPECIES: DUF3301 domain-containing protein [Reinekea]MDB9894191.1 DUF3301 domain-containing protein [Reinekea forsetii]MDO7673232.1 DUF3301 domain-containing protein [Reinekea forsetii]
MNLMLTDVLWVGLIIAAVAFWWQGQGVKAFALRKVKLYCEEHNLQLLDESLVIRKFWIARDRHGLLRIQRIYYFEFTSTGEYRYRGTMTLHGYQVAEIEGQSHHMH